MSCDVDKATERLENELWRRLSDGKVGDWAELIVIVIAELILQIFRHFTYITAHSPTLPSLYLSHSSFSNPSFASATSQALHLIHLASRPCNKCHECTSGWTSVGLQVAESMCFMLWYLLPPLIILHTFVFSRYEQVYRTLKVCFSIPMFIRLFFSCFGASSSLRGKSLSVVLNENLCWIRNSSVVRVIYPVQYLCSI